MNYATPHVCDVGYNNGQKHGYTKTWLYSHGRGRGRIARHVKTRKLYKSRGSVHERGVSCYTALQEIVMYMRLRGEPVASKIVMYFASTGNYVPPL